MAVIEKQWMDRIEQFEEKKGKLPKWLGVQPGKEKGKFNFFKIYLDPVNMIP